MSHRERKNHSAIRRTCVMTHKAAIIEENGRTCTEVFAWVGSQAEHNELMIGAGKKSIQLPALRSTNI